MRAGMLLPRPSDPSRPEGLESGGWKVSGPSGPEASNPRYRTMNMELVNGEEREAKDG